MHFPDWWMISYVKCCNISFQVDAVVGKVESTSLVAGDGPGGLSPIHSRKNVQF